MAEHDVLRGYERPANGELGFRTSMPVQEAREQRDLSVSELYFTYESLLEKLPHVRQLDLKFESTALPPIVSLGNHPDRYPSSPEALSIDSEPFNLVDILPVFSLPRLRNVFLCNCFGDFRTAKGKPSKFAPAKSSKISELIFDECCVDVSCMTELVTTCKVLQHFIYRGTKHSNDLYNFTPNELSDILLCQKGSLQVLEVQLQLANLGEEEYEYGSFHRFCELRSLRIEQIYMREDHQLPPALRKLCLEECELPVFDFSRHAASTLRHLETMVLLLPALESPEDLSHCRMLDIPLSTATEDEIRAQCSALSDISAENKVLIHHDPDIWGKVLATRNGKLESRWEFDAWEDL